MRAVQRRSRQLFEDHADVARLLEHWATSKGVSLVSARAQWAGGVSKGSSQVAHFLRLKDRLDMAAYELTGDAFVGKATQLCGSICWWDCPDGTPANMPDQHFFTAADLRLVIEERSSPDQGIFHAVQAFLLRRVEKMGQWASSGAVTVEARLGNVLELVEEIADLRPWTMSWSNVADYLDPAEFHHLARAVSHHPQCDGRERRCDGVRRRDGGARSRAR